MLQVSVASGVGTGTWSREQLARVSQERSLDVLEDVSFGNDSAAGRADVEGVSGVVVPHVVDGVDERGAADLW